MAITTQQLNDGRRFLNGAVWWAVLVECSPVQDIFWGAAYTGAVVPAILIKLSSLLVCASLATVGVKRYRQCHGVLPFGRLVALALIWGFSLFMATGLILHGWRARHY